MSELDLLIYTYKTLVPALKNKGGLGPQLSKLLDDTSLDFLLSLQPQVENLASKFPQIEKEILLLFNSKLFIQINELETISLDQARVAVNSLIKVKEFNPDIDFNSSIEDMISNLDSSISSASIQELHDWAEFINSIPQTIASHDNFLPILSIRIKSLLWTLIQTDTMQGHIHLASTLAQCAAYKDIELTDVVDIVTDQCIDFLETVNDTNNIERNLGNPVNPDPEGSKELIRILSSLDINLKENKKRLEELRNKFQVLDVMRPPDEVRLNQIHDRREFVVGDKILYHRPQNADGVETVIKVGKLQSGTPVAVKIYSFQDLNKAEKYLPEIRALTSLSGQKKCFLQFYGSVMDANEIFIVTELCSKTLAEEHFERRKSNQPFTLDERLSIMNDLLEGFAMMNNKKILHQDIKPANIMFSLNNTIKIIDFNVMIVMDENEVTDRTSEVSVQGTRNWVSPEMLKAHLSQVVGGGNAKINIKPGKSDVFSLGLVFLSLFTFDDLTGKNSEENNEALLKFVKDKVDNEACMNLIQKMLNKTPEKRPSFNKALVEMPSKTTRVN